jgi:RNA polymerase subunit RPABC4/transcription elongation factor Spt4
MAFRVARHGDFPFAILSLFGCERATFPPDRGPIKEAGVMAGTPGYPWPPYSSPSTHEGESQRVHLEAALRMLREQRPQIAAEIGEYFYSLVLQGQMRDPIVLATCRRLYDHEQQVLQVEANLRALPVAPLVNQPPAYVPPIPVNPPTGPATRSHEDAATMVAPPGRSSYDPAAFSGMEADADATRVALPGSQESGDAATVMQRAGTGSHDAQPPALRPAGLDAGEPVIAPVRRPELGTPGGGKTTERRCSHCQMPLRANDTTCPVCGRPAGEQIAQAAQCRRCGTDLRPQDQSCPVCGTPRG